jgi:putative xylitol transport system ATP-binding protein
VTPLLKVTGPKELLGGFASVRGGRFEAGAGAVRALCGGDAAGKSAVPSVQIVIGRGGTGESRRDSREVERASRADALASRVAIIEQELGATPQLTVAETFSSATSRLAGSAGSTLARSS